MKNNLPKYLLLTDPYNSLEGRVLILQTEYPRYIFELNRPNDPQSLMVKVQEHEYHIVIRRDLDEFFPEFRPGMLTDVVKWYHFSKCVSSETEIET